MRKIFPQQSADTTSKPGEECDDLHFLNILCDSHLFVLATLAVLPLFISGKH